ncbi:MAG TPA: cytochrome P450 [Acidimicrobiia bacterium]|nr:cytochrome P450 [Acidimicrobiia bacterium]
MSSSPLGESLTLDQLSTDPHPHLARMRIGEPVAWVPVLGGWLVTRRDLCIQVMRDAETFTVDDPRFSTAQVVGPSMLSLDGPEHRRHRDPFAGALLHTQVRDRFTDRVNREARRLCEGLAPIGKAEIRRDLAGPLAVAVVSAALDLVEVEVGTVLGWYEGIVGDVDRLSRGKEATGAGRDAVSQLGEEVTNSAANRTGLLAAARSELSSQEVISNAAVMMFGGIETSEGMTTSLFWHLLTNPEQLGMVREERSLGRQAVEESLRLEPAAARVDRYSTKDIPLAGAPIRKGDLVIVSLSAANRDPATFSDPDRFDVRRPNSRAHLAFAQGPHACIGIHLAKMETLAALDAVLDLWPAVRLDRASEGPSGLVFRKPQSLPVQWDPSTDAGQT